MPPGRDDERPRVAFIPFRNIGGYSVRAITTGHHPIVVFAASGAPVTFGTRAEAEAWVDSVDGRRVNAWLAESYRLINAGNSALTYWRRSAGESAEDFAKHPPTAVAP